MHRELVVVGVCGSRHHPTSHREFITICQCINCVTPLHLNATKAIWRIWIILSYLNGSFELRLSNQQHVAMYVASPQAETTLSAEQTNTNRPGLVHWFVVAIIINETIQIDCPHNSSVAINTRREARSNICCTLSKLKLDTRRYLRSGGKKAFFRFEKVLFFCLLLKIIIDINSINFLQLRPASNFSLSDT